MRRLPPFLIPFAVLALAWFGHATPAPALEGELACHLALSTLEASPEVLDLLSRNDLFVRGRTPEGILVIDTHGFGQGQALGVVYRVDRSRPTSGSGLTLEMVGVPEGKFIVVRNSEGNAIFAGVPPGYEATSEHLVAPILKILLGSKPPIRSP